MHRYARRAIGLVVPFALILSTAAGADESTDLQQMSQELAALRAGVAQFRAERDETWLNEQCAEQVKALVREVLADADTRTSLLDSSLTAGYDGHFFIASADDAYRLAFRGNVQLRYVANNQADSGDDDTVTGFTVRRVELGFFGHVADPRIDYFIQIAANRDSGEVGLQDLIISHNFTPEWKLYGGRTKAPFMREEIISCSMQQMVERSMVNTIFSPEYVEGVGLGYQTDVWRVNVMLNDGSHSGSVGGTGNDFANDSTDYAVTARGEWKLAGGWDQISDFEAWAGEPTSSVLGAAIDYEAGETGDGGASGAPDSLLSWTVDGSLEHNGFSFYAAVVGRHVEYDPAIGRDSDDYGFTAQSGYMVIPDKLEPFVRFEYIKTDPPPGEDDMLRLLTCGFNYFFHGQNAKFSLDVVYAFDPIVASNTLGVGGPSGLGLVTNAPGEDGQVAGRAQFQFKY